MKWLRNINIVWIFSYGVAGILQTGVFGVIVAENLPRTGAFGLNLMGGAGMFAISIYMTIMGGYYGKLTLKHLPAGADLTSYTQAAAGSTMANSLNDAKSMAGIDLLHTTQFIPIALIIAFGGLVLFMRNKKKSSVLTSEQLN